MISSLKGLYNSLWIQRLTTLIAIIGLLWFLGTDLEKNGWLVGILMVVVLALEYIGFYRGVEYGIITFNRMSANDKARLLKLIENDDDQQQQEM